MYGVDFRGDTDDSWIVCSRDIPGLMGGESTFRCKGNDNSNAVLKYHQKTHGLLYFTPFTEYDADINKNKYLMARHSRPRDQIPHPVRVFSTYQVCGKVLI